MSLVTRAPTRIDLAGGTLDIWPLYLLVEPAATVNLAIDLYTEVQVERSGGAWEVRQRDTGKVSSSDSLDGLATQPGAEIAGQLLALFHPPQPLRLTIHSDAPPQSGLGASSSLGISVAGALNGITGFRYAREELIEIVKNIEVKILRAMTGAQDHYPPVYGGASCLWWGLGAPRREAISVDAKAFEAQFLLAYSHQPHRSGATNWEVLKRFLEEDSQTVNAVRRSGRIAAETRDALAESDWDRLAELLEQEWQARCEMAPAVSSPELSVLIEEAKKVGATACKACGAGGGGCLLIAVPPDRRKKVQKAIEAGGGSIIPYHLVEQGLELITDVET